ncbi:aminoglycoside adenylyltransferase domain-containing protein [Saccharibacillus kuerlensis]|uniref:Streptomycin 3''-adenylyltransferase n=1 Tax=Saccharibacillus kuerlensis TaxID=459527 RepID=A0ABQ2L6H2_9BACL|nr:aminoglycoside adenylyltransferase domain-containing protein [Saccharibacillus kuerlensis]GGO05036.1 streptomycin 3''-adenylyltransferase [Saccharibacillus kuerlensis]
MEREKQSENAEMSETSQSIQEAFAAAEDMTKRCVHVLGDHVAGVYLHGSLAMGGFNPSASDIDLLIVLKGRPERGTLQQLTSETLDLHRRLPAGRDIEFTVVEESSLLHFVHPAPCLYHYSAAHRDRYKSNPDYICGDYEDADLAAQVAVAYERGMVLYGLPMPELYPPIAREHYLRSILHDTANAEAEIADSPVYTALNLCRVLMFLTEGHLASKKEGGEWGLLSLPDWQDVIWPLLDVYEGRAAGQVEVPKDRLRAFARDMKERIREAGGRDV